MNTLTLLATMFLVLVMVCSSPIDRHQSHDATPDVHRRLTTKGGRPTYKGSFAPSNIQHNLRKGEYICGNKVCKLQPGEIPKGCNGVCQYRI